MGGSEEQRTALLDYIREQRGVDFASYKRTTLKRRLEKRLQAIGASDYGEYLDVLQASPEEFRGLLDTLFINITQFFRDPKAWNVLRRQLEGRLDPNAERPVRVWCAGVASGEEAYSVAMLLSEILGTDGFLGRAKIYATDVDDDALIQARQGAYSRKQVADIPEELRARYMEEQAGVYTFRKDLRRALIFGRHDLLEDAPISKLDLLVCRNTLMYFNRQAQDRILARFHFALADHGLLFLGNAEMMLSRRHLFEPLDSSVRLFEKVHELSLRDRLSLMPHAGEETGNGGRIAEQVRLRDLAFRASPVAQILVQPGGTLAMANEAARRQFGIRPQDVGGLFQDVEISYRPVELRAPIERALTKGEAVRLEGVPRHRPDGEVVFLNIEVQPLYDDPDDPQPAAVSIAFTDVSRVQELNVELEQSRNELETAYEELQSTNEELETTNEELQSTIEELETTNEELQSTNEELETMNEELQSTNEEMGTVNAELRERNEAFTRLNAYMTSVMDSVPAGIVVLDDSLRIQMWNAEAEELWGLRRSEVDGHPFLRLDIGLPVDQLSQEIRSSLQGRGQHSERVLQAHDRRGRGIRCRVNISPLVGPHGALGGTILLMEAVPAEEE